MLDWLHLQRFRRWSQKIILSCVHAGSDLVVTHRFEAASWLLLHISGLKYIWYASKLLRKSVTSSVHSIQMNSVFLLLKIHVCNPIRCRTNGATLRLQRGIEEAVKRCVRSQIRVYRSAKLTSVWWERYWGELLWIFQPFLSVNTAGVVAVSSR